MLPAGNARKAPRLAALAVLLATAVTAVTTPAVAHAASVAYVDKGEVWLASLDGAKKARLASARGEHRRRHGDLAGRRAVRRRTDRGGAQQAGPDLELLVVQDLGAGRELHRRGAAQRPERLEPVRLSARLRHHRGRQAPRLRLLELERLLPDLVRSRHVRPAGDQQRAQPDRHRQPDASLALRLADHLARGRLVAERSSTSRTRTAATPTRTASPRGSTRRASDSTSRASTSRPTGAWRRSASRRGTAARRRSARSACSRSRAWIRRPPSRPP